MNQLPWNEAAVISALAAVLSWIYPPGRRVRSNFWRHCLAGIARNARARAGFGAIGLVCGLDKHRGVCVFDGGLGSASHSGWLVSGAHGLWRGNRMVGVLRVFRLKPLQNPSGSLKFKMERRRLVAK